MVSTKGRGSTRRYLRRDTESGIAIGVEGETLAVDNAASLDHDLDVSRLTDRAIRPPADEDDVGAAFRSECSPLASVSHQFGGVLRRHGNRFEGRPPGLHEKAELPVNAFALENSRVRRIGPRGEQHAGIEECLHVLLRLLEPLPTFR